MSLYLVMLAFFVVITAAASFDRTRGTTVLRAVSGAFSSVMPVGADWSRGFPVRPGAVAGTVLQDLDRLLSEGGFTANEKQDLQGDIAMTAQTTALFQDQDVRFKPERRAMLDRLAQALAKVPGAQVTFLIGDQDPLARKRAVFLDDHWPLIAPRTPAAIGIVPGETGLTIRVRVPDAA
ncbi:MAG: hypothetical protein ACFB6R_09325 [Alphaproteobacteria bacterium]